MPFRRRLACSFCGKGADEVAKLVAGPHVYICDGCVDFAKHIMDNTEVGPRTQSKPPSLGRRIISRLREMFGSDRLSRLEVDSRVV
jgi:ATP-dependent Clp protease ATP-binding subunit ClpX